MADGLLTPDALVRLALDRICHIDADVRAFTCTLDAAEASARCIEQRGPLQGLPVAVKDIFDTRDLPTAHGSALYAGRPPPAYDAAMVSVLRRAGAVVVGKSTTTEFAYLHPTATRNPRAPGRTPGGSSAGSAAAVAAGLVPLAIGTQTGGSIIRPASYCGVVGYKPSFGWLPTPGLKCFSWSLDTVGLFARSVADVAWFAQAVAGRALALEGPTAGGVDRWVVGVPTAYPWGELTSSARRALDHGTRALQAIGAGVRPSDAALQAAGAHEAHAAVQGYEAWRSLAWEVDHHLDALSPILREYLLEAQAVTAADYEAGQHLALAARADVHRWFDGADVLLMPSAPDEAPEGFDSTGPSTFNRAWTLLGLPCINVPGAVGDHGCPMGLQLVAPPGQDARLLRAAALLEQALRA